MYILNNLTNGRFRILNTIKLLPYTQQSMRCLQFEPRKTTTVNPKTLRIRGEDSYRRMDGINSDYDLIYKSQLHYIVNMGKLLALITVPPSIFIQLYYYWTGTMPTTHIVPSFQGSFDYANDVPIIMVGFVIMNLLIYISCHAATFRIYQKDNDYIAIMPGYLPRINSKVHFKRGQAAHHPWLPTKFREIFKVNGRSMIILQNRFRRPVDFYRTLQGNER